MSDLKIWNEYYQNKGNRLDQLSARRIHEEQMKRLKEDHKKSLEKIRSAKTIEELNDLKKD